MVFTQREPLAVRCAQVFSALLGETLAIDPSAPVDPTAVELVNFVTSVRVLGANQTLSMKNIALWGGGAAKFTPRRFHAAVLRFGDNSLAGNATALVFSTGKVVIVGAVNREQARFASQIVRLFIEESHPELEGKTHFSKFEMYNVVGKSALGFRPNLQKLQQLYPAASEWEPDLFPGLTLQVWLKRKSDCRCVRKRHKQNDSCLCNSKCLVFDTGNMVVTGVHNRRYASTVCNCVRLFFTDRKHLQDQSAQLPKSLRFDHRSLQKLSEFEIDFIGTRVPTTETGVEDVLDRVTINTREESEEPPPNEPPIFQACDAGQVDMIQFMVEIDPDAKNARDAAGRTPLDRVHLLRVKHQTAGVYSALCKLLG